MPTDYKAFYSWEQAYTRAVKRAVRNKVRYRVTGYWSLLYKQWCYTAKRWPDDDE